MKAQKGKVASALISAAIIAGSGAYAIAAQGLPPAAPQVSPSVSSEASSTAATQTSSKIEMEVSSQMAESKKAVDHVTESKANDTTSSAADSGTAESMTPGVMYFDIIDPQTGKFISPYDANYFPLKKQLGGDAGIVDPYKSKACAPVIEEWRKKQATKH